MGFTNIARCDKSNNNAIGGIGARGRAIRNSIITRSTSCCRSCVSTCDKNFITLGQALQQGGVNSGQILFLNYNKGLVLRDNFTVHNGGFVIFADIINPEGNVPNNSRGIDVNKFAGVFVADNKTLIVHGEIILGNISSNTNNNKDIYGVYNKGTIEISNTGSIIMGDISSVGRNAHGIFQESTIQKHTVSNSAGAIQMGDITSENANAFGVKNGHLNDVRVQIGNVSGSGEVAAVNLFDSIDNNTIIGNMSAHVIAGDVTNSGTIFTSGVIVNDLSGSATCGNVESSGRVTGIDVFNTLSGSATCGNVKGTGNVAGIFVNNNISGSATCGNVEDTGIVSDGGLSGIVVNNNISGSATCGNVKGTSTGTGTVAGINVLNDLTGSATCGNVEYTYTGTGTGTGTVGGINVLNNLTGSATCGNVEGNVNVFGINVDTLSGKATCGDISSTGTSIPANPIEVTGLVFTTVYPEAQVTIGNISATNGICRGATSESPLAPLAPTAILAGTTNIGDITYDVTDIANHAGSDDFYSGGLVFKNSVSRQNHNLSDSFVSYDGVGKGLEFEVSINNNGQYVVTNTNFTNTTGYVDGETITINGEFFGGNQTNNVELRITAVDNNGQIQSLEIDSANSGSPPTNPRVTTTDVITTNGLSGSFSVGNIKHTGTAASDFNFAYIAHVNEISGKITGKNISSETNIRGLFILNTFSGIVSFGDVRCTTTGSYNVRAMYVGNNLSGSATYGDVSSTGDGDVRGMYVGNGLSGSATYGDVSSTGSGTVVGVWVLNNLTSSVTCDNVSSTGDGYVYGIIVTTLSGSATCGNVSSTGDGDVYGISVTTLSGSATCGNVEGTGINSGTISGCTINGNVIIKSASIGVNNLADGGTGKVIIGVPQEGSGNSGTVDDNKLNAYIYGNTIVIP